MANNKDFKVKNGIKPTVYHEGVGSVTSGSVTNGYDISAASYDSVSFDVSSQETTPTDVVFSTDGTKMFVTGGIGDDVNEYTLSTAWDVSTASFVDSFSVLSQDDLPAAIYFKSDGLTMYVACNGNPDAVFQYTLSTAWDVSTASYANKSITVSTQEGSVTGFFLSSDGTKMYICGGDGDDINYYTLSTAWDISTASFDSIALSVSSETGFPTGMFFTSDGLTMFITSDNSTPYPDSVLEYTLTTAWDASTASLTNTFSVASEDAGPNDLTFSADGSKMYIVGAGNDTIYQYSTGSTTTTNTLDLSTGSVFEITPTSDIQIGLSNPAASGTVSAATLILKGSAQELYSIESLVFQNELDVSSQELTPRDIKFNNDGTKLYLCGSTSDKIHQYSVAKPYDISTASYDNVTFSFSSQDATPDAFVFKPDGTKLYMVGQSTDTVYQYSLSAAYDVSTASYDSVSLSVSQALLPVGIEFNSNGTKLFVLDNTGDTLYEYGLSTAYDISTASITTNISVSQAAQPHGFTFNADGTKLFVVDQQLDSVLRWSLTTGFDLTTASYDNVSADLYDHAAPSGVIFTPTGSKMFSVGYLTDSVYEFISEDLPTITYDSSVEWGYGGAPTLPPQDSTADVITFTTSDGGISYKASLVIDGAE